MNISISEIIVVLLIALLVLKPDDMPVVARKLGQVVSRVRGMANKVKHEVADFCDSTSSDKK